MRDIQPRSVIEVRSMKDIQPHSVIEVRQGIIAVDPGPTESAWCRLVEGRPTHWAKQPTPQVRDLLRQAYCPVYIEMIASYGMAVGREVFDTCTWIGRMEQVVEDRGGECHRIFRIDVKTHLCKRPNANDTNVRQALIDRFGPGKDVAIGRKKSPGPLYGMAGDCWAALAVAVTAWDHLQTGLPACMPRMARIEDTCEDRYAEPIGTPRALYD